MEDKPPSVSGRMEAPNLRLVPPEQPPEKVILSKSLKLEQLAGEAKSKWDRDIIVDIADIYERGLGQGFELDSKFLEQLIEQIENRELAEKVNGFFGLSSLETRESLSEVRKLAIEKQLLQRLVRLNLEAVTLQSDLEDSLAIFKAHNITFDSTGYNSLVKALASIQDEIETLEANTRKGSSAITEDDLEKLVKRIRSIKADVEIYEENAQTVVGIAANVTPAEVLDEAEVKIADHRDDSQIVGEGSTKEARYRGHLPFSVIPEPLRAQAKPAGSFKSAAGGAQAEMSDEEAFNETDRDFFARGKQDAEKVWDQGEQRKQKEKSWAEEQRAWLETAQKLFNPIELTRLDIDELKNSGVKTKKFEEQLNGLEIQVGELISFIGLQKKGANLDEILERWAKLGKSIDALKAGVRRELGKKVKKEIGQGIGTGDTSSQGQGMGSGGGGGGFFGRIGKWGRAAILAAAALVGYGAGEKIVHEVEERQMTSAQKAEEDSDTGNEVYDAGLPAGVGAVPETAASAVHRATPVKKEVKATDARSVQAEVGKEAPEKEVTVSSVRLEKGDSILKALDRSGLPEEQIKDVKDVLKRKYKPDNRAENVYKILNLAFADESIEWNIDKNGKVLDVFWLDGHGNVVEKVEREKRVDGVWKKADSIQSAAAKSTPQHGARPAPASGRVAGEQPTTHTVGGAKIEFPGGYAGHDLKTMSAYSLDLRKLAVSVEPGTYGKIEREDGSQLVVNCGRRGDIEVRIEPDHGELSVEELGRRVFGEKFKEALSTFSSIPYMPGENDPEFKKRMMTEMGKYLGEYYPYMLLDGELAKANVGPANNLRKYVQAMKLRLRELIGVKEELYLK